jgi:hypothetical protein
MNHDTQEKTAEEPRSWRVHGEDSSRENHGSTPFAMGFRVRIDPEIDRTKEEQDENRYQGTERQHPELPCFEFAAAGSELPSGSPPAYSRSERNRVPARPNAWAWRAAP